MFWSLTYPLPCVDNMLGKGKLAELRAIARSHKLAAGSQGVPNLVVAIATTQGKTPPRGPTSSRVLPAPERKKLVLRRPKRKAPQVVQEKEEDDEETEDGLITKRTRAAPSSPPALQTPTPPLTSSSTATSPSDALSRRAPSGQEQRPKLHREPSKRLHTIRICWRGSSFHHFYCWGRTRRR